MAIWGNAASNIYVGGTIGDSANVARFSFNRKRNLVSIINLGRNYFTDQVVGLWVDSTSRLFAAVRIAILAAIYKLQMMAALLGLIRLMVMPLTAYGAPMTHISLLLPEHLSQLVRFMFLVITA